MRSIALCDPACHSAFGHNLPVLLSYRKHLQEWLPGSDVSCFVARDMEGDAAHHGVSPAFPLAFGSAILTNSHHGGAHDRRIVSATSDAIRGIVRRPGNHSLVFPSVDLYAALGLAEALVGHGQQERARLYLRFIGVLEFAGRNIELARRQVIDAIWAMQADGYEVRVAVESPAYAPVMSEYLDAPVWVLPPTPSVEAEPSRQFASGHPLAGIDSAIVYAPGTGRLDKGLADLPGIFKEFRVAYPDHDVHFVCQMPRTLHDRGARTALRELHAIPGVTVLPALLEADEMAALYERSACIVLPYDSGTYRLRSSASLTDAVDAAVPVIATSNTGLSAIVDYYNLGLNGSIQEFPSMMDTLLRVPATARRRRARRSRERFHEDSKLAWTSWLGGSV